MSGCACQRCWAEASPYAQMRDRMFLCETCGNKRCPHATDHRNLCTGSNAPGQAGSWYGEMSDEQRAAVLPLEIPF